MLNIADSDDRPTQERYQGKLHAIGYGFLVPVFFIVTGVRSTSAVAVRQQSSLALMLAILAAILIAGACPPWSTGASWAPGPPSRPASCRPRR